MSLLEVGPLAWAVLGNKGRHHANSEVKLPTIFPKDPSSENQPLKTCKVASEQVT